MPLFGVRYDLRCPEFSRATPAQLAATAIEQCEWADRAGFGSVTLSEHHGSPDGYLPSPLVLAAAIAARTVNLRIVIAALIAPLHDPVRLAEDVAYLDVVSNGRAIPVVSGGYVEAEFAAMGKKLSDRARVMDEIVPFLERAWTSEPFEWHGRRVRVTPRPVQQPRPPIFMGGASAAAARRAARFADHFIPTLPPLFEVYRAERVKLGKPDPGPAPRTTGNFVWVAEDPDAAWRVIAPHALHEMNAYGRWAAAAGDATGYTPVSDADALRKAGHYRIVTPAELVAEVRDWGPFDSVILHPLMGGLDPEFSWECLRLVQREVMPKLR
jgi:alkanesulfonate monooxygenase SsuD/methylene tetrahydromethanopterin reductase-like flavin-dependent oxidoreductase (luciferase family)